jgi:PAS domain S-box-containing protein
MLPRIIGILPVSFIPVIEVFGIILVGSVINLLFWINRKNLFDNGNAVNIISSILDGSPIASFVINKRHQVVLWNTAIQALTGIKDHEIIGTTDHWKVVSNTDQPLLADLIIDRVSEQVIEKRYPGRFRKSRIIEGAYDAEIFSRVSPDNDGKWLRFTASPIRDKQNRIIGAIETLEDITERISAETALIASERNYRHLFESALDAIWINDLEGNIWASNKSAERLTGHTISELNHSNLSLFLTGDSLTRYRKIQDKLIQGQPLGNPYEQKIIRKDGSEVICMVTTNLLTQGDINSSFQSIARDVTEEKRLYENQSSYLKEITRAQEEERKRIARELHDGTAQTLIALLHQVERLLDDKADFPVSQTKSIWVIYERIRDILQEVRRFSRDLRPSILDDLGLVPALDWLTGELKSNYGIDASLIKTGEERRLTPEAELLFFRIAQESLTNVVKHAQASKVEVNVIFAVYSFAIAITDNGSGFSPPQNISGLARIGKLGLAGMVERVQLMNGTITISSEPGKGTTIRAEAPV